MGRSWPLYYYKMLVYLSTSNLSKTNNKTTSIQKGLLISNYLQGIQFDFKVPIWTYTFYSSCYFKLNLEWKLKNYWVARNFETFIFSLNGTWCEVLTNHLLKEYLPGIGRYFSQSEPPLHQYPNQNHRLWDTHD